MTRYLFLSSRLAVLLVVLVCTVGTAIAQPKDGTIILREAVVLPDDAPERVRELIVGVTLERIVYASDGLEVEGFLARPAEAADEKRPCVIFNRGGNRDFGGITPIRAAFMLGRIAKRGYVVVASNYRGNGEFG